MCLISYIYFNNGIFFQFEEVLTQKFTLKYPVYAIQDADNNHYIIGSSRRRVSKIDPSGKVVYRVSGGSREETQFFYANEIEVDNEGHLYVLNYIADQKGFYLSREEILRYSPEGRYEGVIYRKDFSEQDKKAQLIQRGEVFSLEVNGDILSWFNLTGDGITKYNYDIKQNKLETGDYYPLPEANIVVSDIVQLTPHSFVYSSKYGVITQVLPNKTTHVLFSAANAKTASGEFIVPWEVGVDASGKVYFIDLEGKNIRVIVSPSESQVLLDQSTIESQLGIKIKPFNYYRLSVNPDGTLITCNDEAVVTQNPAGKVSYFTSADLPLTWQLRVFVFWGSCLSLLFLIPWAIYLIYLYVLDRKIPNILALSIGIATVVTCVAALSGYYFITNFSERYQHVVFEKLSQVIQLVPQVLDEGRIEQIKEQSDFNGEDYKYVYNTLYKALNYNQDYWNEGYYFALYRVINQRLYGFMYIDGRINMYYPFDWLGDGGVYDQALAGKIVTEATTDITGDWIYGVGPMVNNDGKVVALLEIGTDLYYLRLENNRLIKELILNLAVVLIVFILLLIEISYISELHKKKYQERLEHHQPFSEVRLIRPLSFLYFAAISVSVTFIPLLMKKFYEPIYGLSQEVVLALPLSLEMFFFGIGTTVAGVIASHTGWKWTFYLGLSASSLGLLLSGLADDMLTFSLARSITGIGGGFSFIAMRSFINQERNVIERSQGFSQFYAGMTAGISVGAVFGGTAASHIGFSNTFFVALGIISLALIFQLIYLRQPFFQKLPDVERRESVSLLNSLKIFVMSGKNLVFFAMIIFPTYIAGTFAGYYFPLFAESQGLSTASTGLFIISGGLLVIYLGPSLSYYLERQWGTYRSMIFGSVLWGVSLIVFALTGDLVGAIITLVLMGITEGFCVTAQNEFFLRLPLVAQLGEDRAVGYFEFFSSVAETIGPMTFAIVLISGTMGLMLLGAGIIISTGLFVLLTRSSIS
ncbi:MAG: MFS transporter [Thiotrichaceae bacterium]